MPMHPVEQMRARKNTISVLCVEDDVINQEVLRTMLHSSSDIDLHVASDEIEAIEQVERLMKAPPDVVLMDQQLGHVTGVEVRFESASFFNYPQTN
jgi:CheY-like chemotaxis protein